MVGKLLCGAQEAFWQQLFNSPSGELHWQPAPARSKDAPAASNPPPVGNG